MKLRKKSKVLTNFNMSGLTDIIFLLLIFFILTSTLKSTNALNLTLPNSDSKTEALQSVSISINEHEEYFIDTRQVSLSQIERELSEKRGTIKDATVVLNAEKTVPLEKVVAVMNICNNLKLQMILATNPKK